jgi:hypothetical protein
MTSEIHSDSQTDREIEIEYARMEETRRVISEAVEAERERCAKIAEECDVSHAAGATPWLKRVTWTGNIRRDIAAAIRGPNKQPKSPAHAVPTPGSNAHEKI